MACIASLLERFPYASLTTRLAGRSIDPAMEERTVGVAALCVAMLAVAHLSGNAQDARQVTSRRFQSRAYEGVTLFGSRDAKLYEIKSEGTDLDFSGTEIKVVSSIQQERGAKRR